MRVLQGTWNIVALEVDGSKMADGMIGGSQITLKGKRFSSVSMGASHGGTFTVDETSTPHRLDVTFTEGPHAGQQSLGIFKLQDDTWTLCIGMAGAKRPRGFKTTPGSGHALETLTRSAAQAPKAAKAATKDKKRSAFVATAPASKGRIAARDLSPALAEHQGEWVLVSLDQNGKPTVEPAHVSFGRRVVHGSEMAVTMNGMVMLKVTFTVAPSTTPRSVDYTLLAGANKGKQQRGIYELKGDTARFCMSAPDGERPREFVTHVGDGRTLSVWRKL
jgi:uncharacterized protein (TIGR03067 family)